jgi:hypothetical protein
MAQFYVQVGIPIMVVLDFAMGKIMEGINMSW